MGDDSGFEGTRTQQLLAADQTNLTTTTIKTKTRYVQEPIAVVGLACRLPGDSNSPTALWDFLYRGGVAENEPPKTRFNLKGHFDGSRKNKTMRSPGGMFLENVDPADFDAGFFGISRVDAVAMDPQQRQLLEVVYEGLENAGLTLEGLDGQPFGCFVGSYAVDYSDMHARDPEDRPPSVTIGVGRAILSNRISHFLNITGPSYTVDTACSGSLVALDTACRYLNTGEINGAIVAAANLYLNPEHNMDGGAMRGAASASGKCHTFDVKADGYIKGEAINTVILKRLDDAIRDGDPIRAIIRGTSTNSDGRTPGIASPSSEAQAAAIRAAYANAGITDYNSTTYLECHGTGTQAGDPIEVTGASSVFAATRLLDDPLIIGSIKSNVGHSEPAAGISGLLKAILSLEKGYIPGNPTFITPNPKIDFRTMKVRATRTAIPWPQVPFRRASVNSFGYGGSNAHVVLDEVKTAVSETALAHVSSFMTDYDDLFNDDDDNISSRPHVLAFSANDEASLKAYVKTLSRHLINPNVNVKLPDLAYTLSERRSRLFHRGYVVTSTTSIDEGALVSGKKNTDAPKIGFVFTGQGAQWSQMGKGIVETFPAAKLLLKHLDDVLQSLPTPPSWSLLSELTEARTSEHLRLPEFSQPLVTALQLVLISILEAWGVSPQAVVGHSSGEIAAACAAGLLTQEEAIKIAFLRGQAAKDSAKDDREPVGMMAVGLGAEKVQKYISESRGLVQIGCYNSPNSVTLSGNLAELEKVKVKLQTDSHFARLLLVDLAYHSAFMTDIADTYERQLLQSCEAPLKGKKGVSMYSSVTGGELDQPTDFKYWKSNMVSPVRFDEALREMVSTRDGPDFLIELGPSGALAGPINQIKKGLTGKASNFQYVAAASRGPESVKALFDVAGKLFIAGGPIDLAKVNRDETNPSEPRPSVIVDLPNYIWNHSTKYWHESEASKEWRYRLFPHHDILGSKVLGTSWHAPSFKKVLRVEDLHWLKDHKMGNEIVFPAAGFVAMAVEALYQSRQGVHLTEGSPITEKTRYRLRNITFSKALVLDEKSEGSKIMLTLSPKQGSKDSWHEFRISSLSGDIWNEHSRGLVTLEEDLGEKASEQEISPLKYTTPGRSWYKAMHDAGYTFGPLFQKHLEVESVSDQRRNRSYVDLTQPEEHFQQSPYPMHPVCIDGCFQTVGPSLWKGNRSTVSAVLVPAMIDSIVINSNVKHPDVAISVASSEYTGVGRQDDNRNFMSNAKIYDPKTGALLFQVSGLRYSKLDTREDVNASHSYSRVDWKPDVTFLTQEKLSKLSLSDPYLSSAQDGNFVGKLNQAIDLIAHKKPNLKVIEVNSKVGDLSSIWLDGEHSDRATRAASPLYHLTHVNATCLTNATERYEGHRNTEFSLLDLSRPREEFSSQLKDFDLVIAKLGSISEDTLANVIANARKLVSNGGFVIFVEDRSPTDDSDSDDIIHVSGADLIDSAKILSTLDSNDFEDTLIIADKDHPAELFKAAYLSRGASGEIATKTKPRIDLVHLAESSEVVSSLKSALIERNWQVEDHSFPFLKIQPGSVVLILDDLSSPVFPKISEEQWQAIKELTYKENRILWVTVGSQMEVTIPENAMIHGLGRVVRAEDPSISLTTLDVESATGPETIKSIETILQTLDGPAPLKEVENEFVERRGVLHVARVRPDDPVNQSEKERDEGAELVVRNFHESKTCIRYKCERIGTLDSLRYAEVSETELPLRDDSIEVELYAAGVNFKDVAVTMGIVPENEHLPGLEGAGIVRRVGKFGNFFKVGQRVLVYVKGTFANRVQVTPERTFLLPDSVSFEQASTMPSVYLVVIYGLLHKASLQKGQTVLIHSASGGVGIAAIQVARHVGASEIFVTCGTEDKRKFLIETMGIPPSHIFTSRSTAFAPQLKKLTNGRGVDVILNSLTGDLLEESWLSIADGGTLVEIGKRDVLDRNNLSMEPFNRNASYCGVDMSHIQISDPLIAVLISEMMGLLANGSIKPIEPMKVFPFEDIAGALRYLRGGTHLGKIVISNGPNAKVEVPAVPAPRELSLPAAGSTLIVGGLKGLCGSLAIYLARSGAKHIAIMSRSGYNDDMSQGVLKDLYALGCQVDLIKGDVSVLEDVQRAFKEATVPITGIIQGAMVLRDKIYTSMTITEFHESILPKLRGTHNLHLASLEQSTPLSFFTLLSSVSGIVGNKGQANYAAANAYLDAFAAYRNAQGLPASSVALGVIQDVGYVAQRAELEASFDVDVWTPINESLLHQILRVSILQQTPNPINPTSSSQLITGLATPQSPSGSAELLADARFLPLFLPSSSSSSSSSGGGSATDAFSRSIAAFLLAARTQSPPTEHSILLASIVDIINHQFTTSLRLPEPMEPGKPLAAYGLDSLAAVEFRNWARRELGVELATLEITSAASLWGLGERILGKVDRGS